MSAEIRPLRIDEVEKLGAFLCEGFRLPKGIPFAAPDVLRWKYLEQRPGTFADTLPRSWVASDPRGEIVGHVGIWPTRFRVVRDRSVVDTVMSLHMIDWLASPEHRGVGARLMRQVHGLVESQYAFGGTQAGRQVVARSGYEPMSEVAVFRRVLRPSFHLREGSAGGPIVKRVARSARDLVGSLRNMKTIPSQKVELEPVAEFTPEDDQRLERLAMEMVFPGREATELNVLLNYPRGGLTGWRVWQGAQPIGHAMLSVQSRGNVRVGKIADLFLDRPEVAFWHAASLALTAELARLGADEAVSCGSTPWAAEGLVRAGYRQAFNLEFRLRDRSARLPRNLPYHVGFVEADYATLP